MKSPVMAILIDDNQKKDIKSIEQFVRNTLNPRKLRFVVLSEALPDDQLQNDSIIYIVKKDFNVFGCGIFFESGTPCI
jgi:hypothetical protein